MLLAIVLQHVREPLVRRLVVYPVGWLLLGPAGVPLARPSRLCGALFRARVVLAVGTLLGPSTAEVHVLVRILFVAVP